jgi:hypothetical protein
VNPVSVELKLIALLELAGRQSCQDVSKLHDDTSLE